MRTERRGPLDVRYMMWEYLTSFGYNQSADCIEITESRWGFILPSGPGKYINLSNRV
jgi:hypothetical protein